MNVHEFETTFVQYNITATGICLWNGIEIGESVKK
jgi:hypothetical protein